MKDHYFTKDLEKLFVAGASTIYKIDDKLLLKVYRFYVPESEADRELKKTRQCFFYGISSCITYNKVKVDDSSYGIVLEYVRSPDMSVTLHSNYDLCDKYADKLAYIFNDLHKKTVNDIFIDYKQKYYAICDWIKEKIDVETSNSIREILNVIPERFNFIHGDFHCKNVLYDDETNKYTLVDLSNCGYGHPIFDVMSFIMAQHVNLQLTLSLMNKRNQNMEYLETGFKCFSYAFENSDKTEDPANDEKISNCPVLISYKFFIRFMSKIFKLKNEEEFHQIEPSLNILGLLAMLNSGFMYYAEQNPNFLPYLADEAKAIASNKDMVIDFLNKYLSRLEK